jgi:hypothetical protein
MKARNTVLKLIAVLTLVTIGTAWAKNPVNGAIKPQIVASTGQFGITQNQTARLNVFNGGKDDPGDDDDKVELSFVDGDGNILSQKVYELEEGKSAFLDLKGGELPRTGTNRTQMRAMVRYVGTPDTRTYMWTPTLEVFDNESGETRFLLPAVQKVQKVGQ